MFSMLKRSFETILAGDSFAFEHGDFFEPLLPDIIKLCVNIGEKFVLLFLRQSSTSLAFDFWKCIHGSVHAINFE